MDRRVKEQNKQRLISQDKAQKTHTQEENSKCRDSPPRNTSTKPHIGLPRLESARTCSDPIIFGFEGWQGLLLGESESVGIITPHSHRLHRILQGSHSNMKEAWVRFTCWCRWASQRQGGNWSAPTGHRLWQWQFWGTGAGKCQCGILRLVC